MLRDAIRAGLLLTGIVGCSSDGECDDAIGSASTAHVALFDQEGRPVCNRGRIEARQAGASWHPLGYFPDAYSVLLPSGWTELVAGQSCNLYYTTGTLEEPIYLCGEQPLQWRVAVDGCEPSEGTWTRAQNAANGQGYRSFYVPVRLRCTRTIPPGADASTDTPDASSDVTDVPRK